MIDPYFCDFGAAVRVRPLRRQLGHGLRRVLEREEWRHRVRLEALLQVLRGSLLDGWRAKQTRAAHPHVQTAKGVENFVDEHQRLILLGHVERVRYHLRVRVFLGNLLHQRLVAVHIRRLVAGCRGRGRLRAAKVSQGGPDRLRWGFQQLTVD